MQFLYPYFNSNTHQISGSLGVSIEYPDSQKFDKVRDYPISDENIPEPLVEDPSVSLDGVRVCVIREHTGYKSLWSLVKVIDKEYSEKEYYEKEFYVLTKKLINIGNKQSYSYNYTEFSKEDRRAIEVNPNLKEIFIPYIDKYNGLYSVRVQISYEKILDMRMFKTMVENVYREGISILLSGRGYSSNNETIEYLTNKYYTFGYVQNDLDLTKKRACEPLTFTVSMPLNFFDNVSSNRPSISIPSNISNIISFTNKDFVTKIDNIMLMLSEKDNGLKRELFPNKRLSNYFGISSELMFLKHFSIAIGDVMASVECPISPNAPLTTYLIGLNNNFDIIYVNIKKQLENNTEEITFNEGLLSACRLDGNISNKRILNYFVGYQNMVTDINNMNSTEFFIVYSKFPPVMFEDDNITINGQNFTPEKIKEFRMSIASKSEKCFTISEGFSAAADTTQLFSDSLFHLFASFDPNNEKSVESISKQVSKNLELLEKQYKQLKSSSQNTSWWSPVINYFPDAAVNIGGAVGRTGVEIAGSFDESLETVGNRIGNFWNPRNKDGNYDTSSLLANINVIFKRIKLEEILLKAIICNLKGTPANDPVVREILSKLPEEIINFFLKWMQTNSLSGAAYVYFIENGGSFNSSICSPDELVLVLKVISKIVGGTNTVFKNTVSFVKEIDGIVSQYSSSFMSGKAYNPYKAIINGLTTTIYDTILDITFDYAKNALTAVCDDDMYNDRVDNFSSPLGTHTPVQSQDGIINNNKDILKGNIANALDQSIPYVIREMRYGSDLEYTVDLISLLIDDVKCILSPRESVDLLRGEPQEEVIIIVKNIIRNKYSKDPNNLSYLLDGEKLKMFFKKLGYTVDNAIMNQMVDMIPSADPGDLCSPERLKYREQLLNDSFPSELPILQQDIRRRVERAKKLFEKIENGQPIVNISALCPDDTNPEIVSLKSDIVKQYMDSIRSMFSSTLTSFTAEASALPQILAEEKVLTRKDKNGTLFEGFKYNNFYSNLGKNLTKYIPITGSVQGKFLKQDTSAYYFKTLYKNYNSSPIPKWQLEDMFLKTETAKYMVVQEDKCASGSYDFKTDEMFKKFLSEGRVIWENRPYDRKWDNIDKQFSERGGAGVWESRFSEELRVQQPSLYEYIKEKEYVLFISSETIGQIDTYPRDVDSPEKVPNTYRRLIDAEAGLNDWVLGIKNAAEKIVFRLVRYSSPKDFTDNKTEQYGDFKILASSYVEDIESSSQILSDEEKIERLKRRKRFRVNFSNYTSEIISNLQYDRSGEELINTDDQFYSKYYPNIKVHKRIFEEYRDPDAVDWMRDRNRYSSYIINDKFLDIINAKQTQDGAEFKELLGYFVPVGFDNTIETLNIFQKAFTDIFKTKVEEINRFDLLFRSSEKFQKNGIFNIVTTINNNNSIITKDVFIPGSLDDNDLEYIRYYSIPLKKTIKDDFPLESHVISKLLYEYVYTRLNDETQINFAEKTRSWQTLWLTETKKIKNAIQQEVDAVQQLVQQQTMDLGYERWDPSITKYLAPNALDFLKKKTYIKDIEVDITNEQTIVLNESYKLIPEVVFTKPPDFFNQTGSVVNIESLIDFELSVKDAQIKMTKNMDYQDPYLYNYSKYAKLDMSKDLRYKNCNLYPHYLNLEYFINSISNGAVDKLCDSNLNQVPKDVLKEVLINLTIRTNVTDNMVKLIPLLSLFTIQELLSLNTKQEFIDIIRTHIAREMATLTSNISLQDPNNYYNIFSNILNQFYSEDKNTLKINDRFKLSTSTENNLHIDSLISREIKHFISFCIDNTIFHPAETHIVDDFKTFFSDLEDIEPDPMQNDMLEYVIKTELYGLIIYFLMANTVDGNKRGIFGKTKIELFNLFYKSVELLEIKTTNQPQQSDEDIIKFINGISNSGNPSALAYTNPQFSKYINFFLQASRQQVKSILGTVALQTEQNMLWTRIIQTTLGYVSNTTWSLLDDSYRNKSLMETYLRYYKENGFEAGIPSINSESAYTLKRISEGKSPLADWMVSAGIGSLGLFAWNLFPGVYTLAYGALDLWEYVEWRTKSHEEIKKAVEGFLAGKEVCQVNEQEINGSMLCQDNYETLLSEINKHEEI